MGRGCSSAVATAERPPRHPRSFERSAFGADVSIDLATEGGALLPCCTGTYELDGCLSSSTSPGPTRARRTAFCAHSVHIGDGGTGDPPPERRRRDPRRATARARHADVSDQPGPARFASRDGIGEITGIVRVVTCLRSEGAPRGPSGAAGIVAAPHGAVLKKPGASCKQMATEEDSVSVRRNWAKRIRGAKVPADNPSLAPRSPTPRKPGRRRIPREKPMMASPSSQLGIAATSAAAYTWPSRLSRRFAQDRPRSGTSLVRPSWRADDEYVFPVAGLLGVIVAIYYWRKADARKYADEVWRALGSPGRAVKSTNSTTVWRCCSPRCFRPDGSLRAFITDKIYTF